MSVTEFERHQIFEWYKEHMGPERSATMMALLPPVGWGDITTKADLRTLEISLSGDIARLDGKIDRLRGEVDGKIERLRGEVDGKIDRLDGKIDGLRGDLLNEMAKLRAHIYGAMIGSNIAIASIVLAATRLG